MTTPAQRAKVTQRAPAPERRAASFDLEKEGLEGAFREFSPYVAAIGMRLLGRDDEVDDLVQDVFLRAHRNLHTLRNPDAIKGWLARITVNTAMSKLHKRRAKQWLGLDRVDYLEQVDPALDPERRMQLAETLRLLDKVPVKARAAWTLRVVQGEKLQDVARLCNCSLSTAKRRIAVVSELLEREGGQDHGG